MKNETPLLSLQIINALVTWNKSAKAKNNKNAKIGWKHFARISATARLQEKLPSANREKYQKTNRLKRNFSQFCLLFGVLLAERTTRNVKKYFPAWRAFGSLKIFVSLGCFEVMSPILMFFFLKITTVLIWNTLIYILFKDKKHRRMNKFEKTCKNIVTSLIKLVTIPTKDMHNPLITLHAWKFSLNSKRRAEVKIPHMRSEIPWKS